MKKSEIFKKAQLAVLRDENITFEESLEILNVLMGEERVAKFSEENENEAI